MCAFSEVTDLRCGICREISACLLCECQAPSLSVCVHCLPHHLSDSPGEHSQLSPGVDEKCCTEDGSPAYYFCLCDVYVCSACLPKHHPPRGRHQVFPLCLLSEFYKDNSGKSLRQGELIDKISAALLEQAKGLKVNLVRKVASTFDALEVHLQNSREKALIQVIKYVNEFERESAAMVQKLRDMKYSRDWIPRSELETIIQSEDKEAISDLISSVADWNFELEEYKRKWDSFSRLKNWKYLQKPPAQEPSCVAMANGKTQVFALPTLQPVTVSPELALLEGSLICLPTTEWFFCDAIACHLISPEFSGKRLICNLQEQRKDAGLVYCQGCVYLFGGRTNEGICSTAECVDLDIQSSRMLLSSLPLSFYNCTPCRQGKTLYLGCFPLWSGCFSFHLISERFEMLPITFQLPGMSLSLALPNSEVIVLSDTSIYTYQTHASTYSQLPAISNIEYMSITAPVRHQGVWYFLGNSNDLYMLFSLSETSKQLKQEGTFEKPLNLLERMLAGELDLGALHL